MANEATELKQWTAPRAERFGSFSTVTQQAPPCVNKTFGVTDGFFLEGQPITCVS
jgi:hypothetical protein